MSIWRTFALTHSRLRKRRSRLCCFTFECRSLTITTSRSCRTTSANGLSIHTANGYILPRPPKSASGRSRIAFGAEWKPDEFAIQAGSPGGFAVPSVEERVIQIVCDNLGVNKEQVTRKTSFIEDVGADSLDIVELIMELEEEFEINIPDEQAEKIKTVGEAIDYIEAEIKKK
jgi:acyl carrier protein